MRTGTTSSRSRPDTPVNRKRQTRRETKEDRPRAYGEEIIMATPKRIAVVVRDRESEALRMALGLTLADDAVSVYVVDHRLAANDDDLMNIELLKEMGVGVYSNRSDEPLAEFRSAEQVAHELVAHDHILPY